MEKEKNSITVPCNITGRSFARFAMYDTFVRRKGYRAPLAFVLLMGAFAAVCFTLLRDREQASLLGTVLLSVGLVLPVIWVLMYIVSVRGQIKKLELSESKTQYTVSLDEEIIHVSNGREETDISWDKVTRLVDKGDCCYLYVEKGRAFILPVPDKREALLALAERKLSNQAVK